MPIFSVLDLATLSGIEDVDLVPIYDLDEQGQVRLKHTNILNLKSVFGEGTIEWSEVQNKPSEFTPTSHTHLEAEITDLDRYTTSEVDSAITTLSGALQSEIDAKSDTSHDHDSIYLKIDGSTPIAGNFLPEMTGAAGDVSVRNIGSPTQKFNSLYVHDAYIDAGSLYVNEKLVIEDVSDTITISTDTNQDLAVQTTGLGTLRLTSQERITIQSTQGVEAAIPATEPNRAMTFYNGSPNGNINFSTNGTGGQIQFYSTDEIDLTAPLIDLNGVVDLSGAVLDNFVATDAIINGSMIVGGNFTVSGTTFYTQTETVQISDNTLVLNYGEVNNGVTEGEAGIEIDRGTATNYKFIFDETQDNFRIGENGAEQAVATREDNPIDGYIPVWSSADIMFSTASGLDPSTLSQVGHAHDDLYYTENEIDIKLATLSGNIASQIPTDFYTTGEVDGYLANKSDTTHNHNLAELTEHSYNSLTDKPSIPSVEGLVTETYVNTVSGVLQAEIDTKADNSTLTNHTTDSSIHFTEASIDKYTQAEVDTAISTASGTLQTQINNKSDLGHTHTESDITDLGDYAELSDLATLSGILQNNIDNVDALPDQTGNAGKFLTTNGTDAYWQVQDAGVTDHGLLNGLEDNDHPQYLLTTDFTVASGNIVAQIPTDFYTTSEVDGYLANKSDTTHNHNLADLTEHSYNSLTDKPSIPSIAGLASETYVDTVSGVLQSNIDGKSDTDHNHNGVYEPADADIQLHLSDTNNPHSVDETDVLPAQAGHTGKYLITNGVSTYWNDITSWSGIELPGTTGTVTLASGTLSKAVIYDEELTGLDSDYSLQVQLENTIDTYPSLYTTIITERDFTGFTVEFSSEIDSPNYKLHYVAGAPIGGTGGGTTISGGGLTGDSVINLEDLTDLAGEDLVIVYDTSYSGAENLKKYTVENFKSELTSIDPSSFGNWVPIKSQSTTVSVISFSTGTILEDDVVYRATMEWETDGNNINEGISFNGYFNGDWQNPSRYLADNNSGDNATNIQYQISKEVKLSAEVIIWPEKRKAKYYLSAVDNANTIFNRTVVQYYNYDTPITSFTWNIYGSVGKSGTIKNTLYKWQEIKPIELHSYELVKEYNLNNEILDDTFDWDGETYPDVRVIANLSVGRADLVFNGDNNTTAYAQRYLSATGAGTSLSYGTGSTYDKLNICASNRFSVSDISLLQNHVRGTVNHNGIVDGAWNIAWWKWVDSRAITSLEINTNGQVATGNIRVYRLAKTHLFNQTIYNDKTLNVATTGSDITGDGTSQKPFASINGAIAWLKNKTINTDVTVTIQVADGTYNNQTTITILNQKNLIIQGNVTTPANVVLNFSTGNNGIVVTKNSYLTLAGLKLVGYQAAEFMNGITAEYSSVIYAEDIIVDGFGRNIISKFGSYLEVDSFTSTNGIYGVQAISMADVTASNGSVTNCSSRGVISTKFGRIIVDTLGYSGNSTNEYTATSGQITSI